MTASQWCIKTTKDVFPNGEIYVIADGVMITPCGALKLLGKGRTILIIAPNKWLSYYAISLWIEEESLAKIYRRS